MEWIIGTFLQGKKQILWRCEKGFAYVVGSKLQERREQNWPNIGRLAHRGLACITEGMWWPLVVGRRGESRVQLWNLQTHLREHLPPALGSCIESGSVPVCTISKGLVGVVWVWTCGCQESPYISILPLPTKNEVTDFSACSVSMEHEEQLPERIHSSR